MPSQTRQTTLLSIHGFFTFPFACIPFLYFYFADRGIGIEQFLQMIALYYWAMVVLEIPTGILADRCGRKLALSGGSAVLGAGFLVIYFGDSFATFCVGQVILGLGHSLLSGAPTALLYDDLALRGETGTFLRAESRIHALRLLGTGGSFLLGGGLAYGFGIAPTILLTAALCFTGAVVAGFLVEPARKPAEATVQRLQLLRRSASDLRSPQLVWILVYFVFLFGLLRFAFHTYQPFFEEAAYDATDPSGSYLALGLLFAALNLVAAPASRMAPLLSRRFRFRTVFFWLPAALSLAFLAMHQLEGWPAVMLFFIHQIPFGIHWALIQDFVNERLDPRSRATTLSILSFAGRISFAAWLPLIGGYQATHGTAATYGLLGAIGLGLTILWCAPGLGTRLLRGVATRPGEDGRPEDAPDADGTLR